MASEFFFSTPYIVGILLPQVWERFKDISFAVFDNPEMLWIVAPLLTTLLMMEFYFGRYRREELGWNTAVGNSLVLIFVSIDLLRQIYSGYLNFDLIGARFFELTSQTFIAFFAGTFGIAILFANFFHAIPKRLAFRLSSVFAINYMAYVSIALVYGSVPLDWFTVAGAMMLFIILYIFFGIVHVMEPKYVARYHGGVVYRLLNKVIRIKQEEKQKKEVEKKKPIIPFLAAKGHENKVKRR